MRSHLLLAGCLLFLVGPSRADKIGLYSDSSRNRCAMPSTPFVAQTVYVFHTLSSGTTGSSWRIENTSGLLALSSSCGGLSITGDPFTGVSLTYGSCLTGDFQICQLQLLKLTSGPVPGCYQLRVLGFPGDAPLAADCSDNEFGVGSGFFTFDIEGKINCWDCATPIRPTTWGRVRSMYR